MITEKEIQHIAHLSRIHIDHIETKNFAKELAQILDYVEKLKEINTDNTTPTTHVLALNNIFREDSIAPSLSQEDVMKMPVENFNGYFKVPQII